MDKNEKQNQIGNNYLLNNFCDDSHASIEQYCKNESDCGYENNKQKREKCITSIICDQATISQYEAQLFCRVTHRLCYELCHASDISELYSVIELINCFLMASATKERAVAEVIESCSKPNTKTC
ncbi:MAG: hypothetical protein PHI90_03390 [Clostridia bacterium]|nr:hypothetical protein [Clostridia bacterium]MDD4047860.1 hypothetical protein [Clostridia bacterium]